MGQYNATEFDVKKNGTQVPGVRKWSHKPTGNNKSYATNQTEGWNASLPGTMDVTGTIDCYADDATDIEALFLPGEAMTLELFQNATLKKTGPARVDDVDIQVDGETGAVVGFTVTYRANGKWDDWAAA